MRLRCWCTLRLQPEPRTAAFGNQQPETRLPELQPGHKPSLRRLGLWVNLLSTMLAAPLHSPWPLLTAQAAVPEPRRALCALHSTAPPGPLLPAQPASAAGSVSM